MVCKLITKNSFFVPKFLNQKFFKQHSFIFRLLFNIPLTLITIFLYLQNDCKYNVNLTTNMNAKHNLTQNAVPDFNFQQNVQPHVALKSRNVHNQNFVQKVQASEQQCPEAIFVSNFGLENYFDPTRVRHLFKERYFNYKKKKLSFYD